MRLRGSVRGSRSAGVEDGSRLVTMFGGSSRIMGGSLEREGTASLSDGWFSAELTYARVEEYGREVAKRLGVPRRSKLCEKFHNMGRAWRTRGGNARAWGGMLRAVGGCARERVYV